MESILLFILVASGALVTSLAGLGGGVLILAGLMLIYPPALAIPLHSFTQLSSNTFRTSLYFKIVNWKVVLAYGSLMLVGAFLAANIFSYINSSLLKIMVGFFILISIIPFKWKPKGEPSLKTFTSLGFLAGFFGVFVGAVGPLVTPFFTRLKLSRDSMLSTKSAGQIILQLSKIIAFSGAGGVDFFALKKQIALLIVAAVTGVALSIPLSKKISDKHFDLSVNILLGLISVKVILEGIRELVNA